MEIHNTSSQPSLFPHLLPPIAQSMASQNNSPSPISRPPGFKCEFIDHMNTITYKPSFSPNPSHLLPHTSFTGIYNNCTTSSSTPTPPPHYHHLPAHFFPPSGFEHKFNHGPNTTTHIYNHPTIQRVMGILKSEFGPNHVLLSSSASSININIDINNSITNNMMRMMLMNSYARSYPHDLHVGSSSQPQGPPSQTVNNNNRKRRRTDDDGRVRSLARDKYGRYLCSKCDMAATTSQRFANHVKHHHPKSSAPAPHVAASADDHSLASTPGAASTSASDHNQITLALSLSGVKIKSEPTNN